ncbi:MAG: type 1 glutamine amidotransferase domain-containing protein [Burkholderiales bacterium]
MARILMILSAAQRLPLRDGGSCPTGFWAQEFVPPHDSFVRSGHCVDIATPNGAAAVLDENCLAARFHHGDVNHIRHLRERLQQITGWQKPLSVEGLEAAQQAYDALFFPGGHAPLVDLAGSGAVGKLLIRIRAAGGLIGAVCHGPAALLAAQETPQWPFSGYRMTCFSAQEEMQAGFAGKLAEPLYAALEQRGARLSHAVAGQAHVVIDGELFTGQNPASVDELVRGMERVLQTRAPVPATI